MENKAKIRINLNQREFEIEGSEDFINSHSDKIENFIELLKKASPQIVQPINQQTEINSDKQGSAGQAIIPTNNEIPKTFGEYYHNIPNASKEVDKLLVAGHYAQLTSSDNSFSTKDATSLLLEQGVKLSNSTVFMNRNEKTKNVIKLAKSKYRVSKTGLEHIQELLSGTTKGE